MIKEIKGAILIISGPSGCGKSTLLKEIYKNIPNYYFSISTTTRDIRGEEEDGIDYHFVTIEEFEKNIEAGNFLEYARVHNNYYGTMLEPITKALNDGKLVVFDIDVQGHKILREKLGNLITSVFITTPTLKILEQRLVARDTDTKEIIEKRVESAKSEICEFLDYDYLIINDNIHKATKEILSIASIARAKTKLFDKNSIVKEWLNS
ncbi:guanylate kinase [Aliarcobacter trophiarum]|uniref:Guanylate kinase n=1 Tax=Aliarcobacter trophiarum LMG 25534 TaxID=1032241 RepID=A0AAD0QK10_9BACT|nr:guanylate kinase [Aliarcobacter trophiarum]AXK49318.1 deoxyguanylate kinase / guanylate kinase [Aliarcobacter trophiarum LMG 25534]